MSDLETLTREQLIVLVQDQEKQITELRIERVNIMQKMSGYVNTIKDLKRKLRGAQG